MGFTQYLKDTQAELRHVAWPTQLQTIVFTILVALVSVGVSLYLGLFDYVFTTSVTRLVGAAPTENPIQVTQGSTTTAPTVTLPTLGTTTTQ